MSKPVQESTSTGIFPWPFHESCERWLLEGMFVEVEVEEIFLCFLESVLPARPGWSRGAFVVVQYHMLGKNSQPSTCVQSSFLGWSQLCVFLLHVIHVSLDVGLLQWKESSSQRSHKLPEIVVLRNRYPRIELLTHLLVYDDFQVSSLRSVSIHFFWRVQLTHRQKTYFFLYKTF